ncbi:MAG TPA: ABC transporter ATP-binding protein, partial [Anaerolineaceae bacterium]|nr:ABC transporter ATP-binding protein [Anaerolineaceae bacterium]
MPHTVISVEHLSKQYDLGVIGTGTLTRDFERWWARVRGKPDPYSPVAQDHNYRYRGGETILALDDVSFTVQQGEAL